MTELEPVKFSRGDYVRKKSGAFWEGDVVGDYSTDQTPDGVCVRLFGWADGPVQIYPVSALEHVNRASELPTILAEMQVDLNIAVEQRNMTLSEMQRQTARATAAEAEATRLRGLLEEARKVIEPFEAKLSDIEPSKFDVMDGLARGLEDMRDDELALLTVEIGHLRAARSLYDRIKNGGNNG